MIPQTERRFFVGYQHATKSGFAIGNIDITTSHPDGVTLNAELLNGFKQTIAKKQTSARQRLTDKDIIITLLHELDPVYQSPVRHPVFHCISTWTLPTQLPDSEVTVLIHCPAEDEPVWLGYYESESNLWRNVEGEIVTVAAWAAIPNPSPRLPEPP